ncbi:MAG: hypothetical protein Edafosvirus2_4 [Edafosvirus sp.]|uniref:Uncharacterized protein n=1 Tax=Edafosvirus sp. TaxID=2487765 RepID=A0A3G4ZSF9_9VIRU|nr:MAG: hypothetical protein Edafosvirus2_4 [Edafosvirus sp.]
MEAHINCKKCNIKISFIKCIECECCHSYFCFDCDKSNRLYDCDKCNEEYCKHKLQKCQSCKKMSHKLTLGYFNSYLSCKQIAKMCCCDCIEYADEKQCHTKNHKSCSCGFSYCEDDVNKTIQICYKNSCSENCSSPLNVLICKCNLCDNFVHQSHYGYANSTIFCRQRQVKVCCSCLPNINTTQNHQFDHKLCSCGFEICSDDIYQQCASCGKFAHNKFIDIPETCVYCPTIKNVFVCCDCYDADHFFKNDICKNMNLIPDLWKNNCLSII